MAPYTIQFRRGTEAEWVAENPILAAGELGYASDVNNYKIGDGVNRWADLPYVANTTVALTQAEYDAIQNPNDAVLYLITDA